MTRYSYVFFVSMRSISGIVFHGAFGTRPIGVFSFFCIFPQYGYLIRIDFVYDIIVVASASGN